MTITQESADDLPPAAILVLTALENADADELSLQALQREALLATKRRTFENAIRDLRDAGLIETRPDPHHPDQVLAKPAT